MDEITKDRIILEGVSALIYSEFLNLRVNGKGPYEVHSTFGKRQINWIREGHPVVYLSAVKDLIYLWVKEEYEAHGRIICFICQENAQILIEDYVQEYWDSCDDYVYFGVLKMVYD